jgi:aryl-alcohol dehydrogenase-like predicted oxidoreductase
MEKRRLGRTGHLSTVMVFGTAAFWEIEQDAADKISDMVLAAGINHIDVAPSYGQAEIRVGPWLEAHRDKFFLGCKTGERGKEDAWAELQQSLKNLRTDSFNLYQLHAITNISELDKVTSPGGALDALVQAREQGLTKYLGITGHGMHSPATFSIALDRFDFDTVMFPIYPTLFADVNYRSDTLGLLKKCAERDVGVMIIKSIAKEPWGDREKTRNTWYVPYEKQQEITKAVHFVLSQPAVTAIASAGDVNILPMVINAAESFQPVNADEQQALIEERQELETIFPEDMN